MTAYWRKRLAAYNLGNHSILSYYISEHDTSTYVRLNITEKEHSYGLGMANGILGGDGEAGSRHRGRITRSPVVLLSEAKTWRGDDLRNC